MWKINKINIENLGTYKNEELIISQNKTFLIVGSNNDDEGQKSNGSGKSWLLEALAISILGDSLKKVTINDLIRNNEKQCTVSIEMNNYFLKTEMKIIRQLNKKGSTILKIWVNGKDQANKFPTVPEGDKFILNQLGISRDDLLNYYLISRRRYKSFFSASDTIKKEVISRFSGADLLNGIDENVQIEIDEKEKERDLIQNQILSLESKKEVYEEDLEKEKERDLEKEKSETIDNIDNNIQSALESIIIKEETISKLKKSNEDQTKLLSNKIKDLNGIDTPNNEENISELNKEIEEIAKDYKSEKIIYNEKFSNYEKTLLDTNKCLREGIAITIKEKLDFETFLIETKSKIEGSVICPSCSHEFDLADKEFSIEDAKKLIPKIEENIKVYEKLIFEKEKQINANKELIQKEEKKVNELIITIEELASVKIENKEERVNALEKEVFESKKIIRAIENDISIIKGKIINIKINTDNEKKQIDIYNQSINDLDNNKKEIQEKQIEKREKELNKNIALLNNKISFTKEHEIGLEKDIYNEAQWLYNFKKFNSYLANQAINTIEGLTNLNLKNAKTNLQTKMEGFKLLKNGDIREKITTTVLRNGINEGLLDKFSEGEKARIELANIISLQQLININAYSGGLDFLGVDEILAALDTEGVKLVAEMLNILQKTVLMITHVGIDTINFENLLIIEKTNTISKIIK